MIAKSRKRKDAPEPLFEVHYKIVETSSVTDDALEVIVNEWVSQGWTFEGMQFAMRESSKRPAMAFVLFTQRAPIEPEQDLAGQEGDHGPR